MVSKDHLKQLIHAHTIAAASYAKTREGRFITTFSEYYAMPYLMIKNQGI